MTGASSQKHVVVVGAGIGGLAAALDLAASGAKVTVVERQAVPGGKMRTVEVDGQRIDSGPTVFTMRWVFDELFAHAGYDLADSLPLIGADVLARHSWLDGSRLDLYADVERSAAAIAEFAGAQEADAYRRFAVDSASIFDTLDHSFMRREKPGPVALTASLGIRGAPRLFATRPFTTLWRELGQRFADPRLRQLFARYSTYCGSSPFDSPATLMLIAHAERAGVWYVEGGMRRLAETLADLVAQAGAEIRYEQTVAEIRVDKGRAAGVLLGNGDVIDADAVVFNGDVAALGTGLLGTSVRSAVTDRSGDTRSLSAITFSLCAEARGFQLDHHTVFFGDDYEDEFAAIFERGGITGSPTVYVCAQDRGEAIAADGAERLFLLINAPPRPFEDDEVQAARGTTAAHLARHGLDLGPAMDKAIVTTPNDYADRFPGSDGAIYGWPTHGWSGTFKRPGSRSRIDGLYFAGGTVHPGPGVPMVALSGRIAAASVRSDLGID